ncbi:hypothetical protein [Ruegeria lacuscaerulensis]|uniref:hypothetical protein n=1 Tax=Ruegeria lacuscaerulensis TaxID=55218 RepID=UPI001480D687|nr:hypothetical protein [Ruegeria lacuscaerulensis]
MEYTGNIHLIAAGIAARLSAEQIDARIRVDGGQALAALAALESLWIEERDQSLTTMVRTFSEGERLVRNFSVLLVGLIILVGVIAILTTFLIANRSNWPNENWRARWNKARPRSSIPILI